MDNMREHIIFNNKLASAIRDGNVKRMRELVKGTRIGSSILLHIAVKVKNWEIIRLLLSEGANIDAYDNNDNTVLHLAVEEGNTEMILFLLGKGANVDVKNIRGNTVLHVAVIKGDPIIVEDILRYRPYIGHRSNKSSLKTAVCGSSESYKRIVLDLLQYGFTSNPEDVRDLEFLHNAVAKEYLKIVEDLLERGAYVNQYDESQYGDRSTPLHTAVQNKKGRVAKLLVKYGANLRAKDKWGYTPIYYDIQYNDAKITKLLITNGANIKNSPELMYYAATNGYLKVVEDLFNSGADVNMVDYSKPGNDSTLLHTAVKEKQEEVAKLLVNYGANVNAKDKMGNTPVFFAVKNNDAKLTKLLLNNGAIMKNNPEILHYAAANGFFNVFEELLKSGADINMINYSKHAYDSTLLHTAVKMKQEEVAKLLVNYGANVNAKDIDGKSPVYYAVLHNNARVTELLLTNGADIEDPDLLNTAIFHGNSKVIDDLLKHGPDVNVISEQLESYKYSSDYAVKMLKNKLLVAGLYVSVRNLNCMDDVYEIQCQHECEGEIEIMKCKKISNSCVSFYDILTKNTHQLAMYAKNENIVQALKSADYKAEFPIYASMIEGKLRRGLKRKDLEELGNQLFHSLYASLPELPLLCIEKIFSYLSNDDLKLLTTCDALNRL